MDTCRYGFCEYACGGWIKNNPLKPEYACFGTFDQLLENNQRTAPGIDRGT